MNIDHIVSELSVLYEDLAQARKDHYAAEELVAAAVSSMFKTTRRIFELEKDVRAVANDRAVIKVRMRELMMQLDQVPDDAVHQ